MFDWLPTDKFSYPDHDCYWLVREIRKHYGLQTPDFKWTYELYPTAEQQPENLTLGCLEQCARIRYGMPKHLDLALFKQSISADLGTILMGSDGELWIVYMSANGAIAEPLKRRMFRVVESYWVL